MKPKALLFFTLIASITSLSSVSAAEQQSLICEKSDTRYELTQNDLSMVSLAIANVQKKWGKYLPTIVSKLQRYRDVKLASDTRMSEIFSNIIYRLSGDSGNLTRDNSVAANMDELKRNGVDWLAHLTSDDLRAIANDKLASSTAIDALPDLSKQLMARYESAGKETDKIFVRASDFALVMKLEFLRIALNAAVNPNKEDIYDMDVERALISLAEMERNITVGPLKYEKYTVFLGPDNDSNLVVFINGPCSSIGMIYQNTSDEWNSDDYKTVIKSGIEDAIKRKLPTSQLPQSLRSSLDRLVFDATKGTGLLSDHPELKEDEIATIRDWLHFAYLSTLLTEVSNHLDHSSGKEKAFLSLVQDYFSGYLYGG